MDVKDLVGLAQQIAFPIFVSVWFLLRLERKIERLTESNGKLTSALQVMTKAMDLQEADQVRLDMLLNANGKKDGG